MFDDFIVFYQRHLEVLDKT